ncbi:hypothetical protein NXW00_23875 [Bacteroides thetaiotaomicron]|nr:hypothetical protein [Bacteroides thetaiotaomicron]
MKNPNFEGEFDVNPETKLVSRVEGWDVVIGDRWNSEQQILPEEIDNNQDLDNHVFEIRPYKWAAGWSDGILMQVVDVVPNESYTLSALLKGGIAKKEGKLTGKMIIEEVQDPEKKSSQKLPVTTGKLIQWTILLLPNVTKFVYPLQ